MESATNVKTVETKKKKKKKLEQTHELNSIASNNESISKWNKQHSRMMITTTGTGTLSIQVNHGITIGTSICISNTDTLPPRY